ncbi:transcriptional regulator [Candidatus Formimonas warabiya]|uniref:Transcriptional regulator n=1 Tax=Formimonas warabiya TaxID=1761012 RepID=A0A3G1KX73_FORW1|nr:transcriptional regulator [Candidatus Formimonas warabiya]ATW27088.1 transcriptional regulator [Candidatus Formimonas warabiya]
MIFGFGFRNKTVKELRKNKGYTVIELANRLKLESIEIKRVDELKLKDVSEPLRSRLEPIFRGDDFDKIPW